MRRLVCYCLILLTLFALGLPGVSAFNFETGGVKIIEPLESNGAIPINIQDQHSRTADIFFTQQLNETNLSSPTAIDDYDIELVAGHGIITGDYLGIYDTVSTRIYLGGVINVIGNVIYLDTPINFAYPTATSTVLKMNREMNVDGSVTKQIFSIPNPVNVELDITRIMFQIISDTPPDFGTFGDISGGLQKGIVLRVVNGINVNYFNIKTNGELVHLMYDVRFFDPSNPGQGVYGIGGRLTYAGQEKHGVTIRLSEGDRLELIVQDDLSSLTTFRILASVHVVTD